MPNKTGSNPAPKAGSAPAPPTPPPPTAPTRITEIGGGPREPSLTLVRKDERVNGWYEDRAPHSLTHQRVRATLVGYRTFVLDGKIVTEAMVLPHERNSSYGFVPLSKFVIPESGSIERGGPSRLENLDEPY